MSRIIPGVIEVFEKETVGETSVPSPVEVRHYWNQVIVDADRVEELMARIRAMILKMRKWHHLGLVKTKDVETAEDWFAIREQVLRYLLVVRSIGVFLEETYGDGAGI